MSQTTNQLTLIPGDALIEIDHTFESYWINTGYRFTLSKVDADGQRVYIPVDRHFRENMIPVSQIFPTDATDGPYELTVWADANHVDQVSATFRSKPLIVPVVYSRTAEISMPRIKIIWHVP